MDALSTQEEGRLDPAAGRNDLFGELERSVYFRERARKNHNLRDEVHRAFLEDLGKEMLEANVREFDWELVQVAAAAAAEKADQLPSKPSSTDLLTIISFTFRMS